MARNLPRLVVQDCRWHSKPGWWSISVERGKALRVERARKEVELEKAHETPTMVQAVEKEAAHVQAAASDLRLCLAAEGCCRFRALVA